MRLGRNTILGGVLLSCLTGLGSPAGAQTFDIPEGFVVAEEPEVADSAEWEPVLTVTPDAGSFSELSRIELRRVTGDVADPDDWLRARMTVDVGTPSDADEMLNSPDSPFADPAFDALKEAIPHLFRGLEQLSKMPLSFCEGPEAATRRHRRAARALLRLPGGSAPPIRHAPASECGRPVVLHRNPGDERETPAPSHRHRQLVPGRRVRRPGRRTPLP